VCAESKTNSGTELWDLEHGAKRYPLQGTTVGTNDHVRSQV